MTQKERYKRVEATPAVGECTYCHRHPRILVACPCRACDRLEVEGKVRWRVCRSCSAKLLPDRRTS